MVLASPGGLFSRLLWNLYVRQSMSMWFKTCYDEYVVYDIDVIYDEYVVKML